MFSLDGPFSVRKGDETALLLSDDTTAEVHYVNMGERAVSLPFSRFLHDTHVNKYTRSS